MFVIAQPRWNSCLQDSLFLGFQDHENLSPSNQEMSHYGVGSSGEDSDQAHKRLRTEQS